MEANLRTIFQEDWMTLLIISTLLLLSWSKFLFPQLYHQFKFVLVNQKYCLSFHKGKMLSHPYVLTMNMIAWLNISLFIYLIAPDLFPKLTSKFELSFLYIAAYTAGFILIKINLQLLLGEVFDNQLIKRLLFSKLSLLSFNSWILSLGSIVLIYLLNHNIIVIYSVSFLVLLLYLIGYVNTLRNHKKYVFSQLLYIILYLCALEIAPVIIIINYLKIA